MLLKERGITEQMDRPIQERVTERLKTYIPQDDVARSNRGPPQHQPHSDSQLVPHTGLPTGMSPQNPPSTTTLSHTSPVYSPHPSAHGHSSTFFGSASTISISGGSFPNVGSPTFAQAVAKKVDTTGASLKV